MDQVTHNKTVSFIWGIADDVLAEVHNGSSLFTGDAGQGESNIRRVSRPELHTAHSWN